MRPECVQARVGIAAIDDGDRGRARFSVPAELALAREAVVLVDAFAVLTRIRVAMIGHLDGLVTDRAAPVEITLAARGLAGRDANPEDARVWIARLTPVPVPPVPPPPSPWPAAAPEPASPGSVAPAPVPPVPLVPPVSPVSPVSPLLPAWPFLVPPVPLLVPPPPIRPCYQQGIHVRNNKRLVVERFATREIQVVQGAHAPGAMLIQTCEHLDRSSSAESLSRGHARRRRRLSKSVNALVSAFGDDDRQERAPRAHSGSSR